MGECGCEFDEDANAGIERMPHASKGSCRGRVGGLEGEEGGGSFLSVRCVSLVLWTLSGPQGAEI